MEHHMPVRRPRVTVSNTFWFEADTPGEARAEALRWAALVGAAAAVEDGTGRALGTALGTADGRAQWLPADLAFAAE